MKMVCQPENSLHYYTIHPVGEPSYRSTPAQGGGHGCGNRVTQSAELPQKHPRVTPRESSSSCNPEPSARSWTSFLQQSANQTRASRGQLLQGRAAVWRTAAGGGWRSPTPPAAAEADAWQQPRLLRSPSKAAAVPNATPTTTTTTPSAPTATTTTTTLTTATRAGAAA